MRLHLLVSSSLLLWALSLRAAEPAAFEWIDPSDPSAQTVAARGQAVAQELVKSLSQEVTEAIAACGPVGAIETCHLKALPLTTRVAAAATPTVLAVKRTSLKVRNPANAPDPAEQAALDRIAALIAQGQTPPTLLVQRLTSATEPREWRVYRPLSIAPGCLACHGNAAAFPPELQTALAARYPADAATGYRDGDWRGVIRVSLHAAPPAGR